MLLHQSVLVNEVLDALQIVANGIYMDGTFGQGGHTAKVLNELNDQGQVIAIDKDPTAAAYVVKNFSSEKRLNFYYHSFTQIKNIVSKKNLVGKINGILLDLGTSATQLETANRGFSFIKEGPLDMRMNPAQGESAAYWIKKVPTEKMISIFREFGEERYAKCLAEAIDRERKKAPIQTTTQLAQIIRKAHPKWPRRIHPATRIFQAIRIHVNQEMMELEQALEQSAESLTPGGRLAVITFHSLEARVVKKFMRNTMNYEKSKHTMNWISKGIKPTAQEVSNNPRARSAILRVMEKSV